MNHYKTPLVLLLVATVLAALSWASQRDRASAEFPCGFSVQAIVAFPHVSAPPVYHDIALALNVSADMLLFEANERGPDDRLKLQFEALSHLDEKEREAVETMIAGVLHMHDAKRWTQAASAAPPTKPKAQKAAAR